MISTNNFAKQFTAVRQRSEFICAPLANEDYSVQPIVDVSPPKWHLAHSTWFFEQFVLLPHLKDYAVFNKDFAFLFNSYYNNAGDRVLRPNRGLMTRPSVEEIYGYRQYVTKHVQYLLEDNKNAAVLDLITIGINHEQQHQELLAYDIKYILGHQPTFPKYEGDFAVPKSEKPLEFITIKEGIYTIGHQSDDFCFDNELGVHKVYLNDYKIANRLVTNREYIAFIEAGAYQNFNLWHAEGWDFIQKNNISAPMYWYKKDEQWFNYDYDGLNPVDLDAFVMHISYFEAFAFAEWKNMRLATEFEWEIAAPSIEWGQLWEWTASAYQPYPRFKKAAGALGEYNGKFMVNQQVLRGASAATPKGHSRASYRNFFSTNLRWMFSGIRLVQDLT